MDAAFAAAPVSGSRVAVGNPGPELSEATLVSGSAKQLGCCFEKSMLLLTPIRNLEQTTRILDVKSPTFINNERQTLNVVSCRFHLPYVQPRNAERWSVLLILLGEATLEFIHAVRKYYGMTHVTDGISLSNDKLTCENPEK